MLRRALSVLFAVLLAVAAVVPIAAHAMPMAGGLHSACGGCAHGVPDPARFPICPVLVCAGSVATLPTPPLPPPPSLRPADIARPPAAPWAPMALSPDPFPPRQSGMV